MEFEKRFCAFIDILGFKEKTKNFEDAVNYYKDYIRSYHGFTEYNKKIWEAVSESLNQENNSTEVEEIIFSDSIILYSIFYRLVKIARACSSGDGFTYGSRFLVPWWNRIWKVL